MKQLLLLITSIIPAISSWNAKLQCKDTGSAAYWTRVYENPLDGSYTVCGCFTSKSILYDSTSTVKGDFNVQPGAGVIRFSGEGVLQWYAFLSISYCYIPNYNCALDAMGNVYMSGYMESSFGQNSKNNITLSLSRNKANSTGGTVIPNLFSVISGISNFVLKITAEGYYDWVVRQETKAEAVIGSKIAVDSNSNVYFASSCFYGSFKVFDTSSSVEPVAQDTSMPSFIMKISPAGRYLWHAKISNAIITKILCDPFNFVVFSGYYTSGWCSLSSATGISTFISISHTSSSYLNTVFGKYTDAGQILFARRVDTGGAGDITLDPITNNIHLLTNVKNQAISIYGPDNTALVHSDNCQLCVYSVCFNHMGLYRWKIKIITDDDIYYDEVTYFDAVARQIHLLLLYSPISGYTITSPDGTVRKITTSNYRYPILKFNETGSYMGVVFTSFPIDSMQIDSRRRMAVVSGHNSGGLTMYGANGAVLESAVNQGWTGQANLIVVSGWGDSYVRPPPPPISSAVIATSSKPAFMASSTTLQLIHTSMVNSSKLSTLFFTSSAVETTPKSSQQLTLDYVTTLTFSNNDRFSSTRTKLSIIENSIETKKKDETSGSEVPMNFTVETLTITTISILVLIVGILVFTNSCLKRYRISREFGSRSLLSHSSSSYIPHSDVTATTKMSTRSEKSSIITSSTTLNSQVSTESTLIGQQGLSIPAFLLFQPGIDYRIKLDSKMDEGGSATLFKATPLHQSLKKYNDTLVAVKQFKQSTTSTARGMNGFYQEVSVMYLLRNHKNIAKMVGYSVDRPVAILMKYYFEGNLEHFLMRKDRIKTKRILARFIKNIVKGLGFMFNHGLAHCDLKTTNILIDIQSVGGDTSRTTDTSQLSSRGVIGRSDVQYFCVISDFGVCRLTSDRSLTVKEFKTVRLNGVTLDFASPELLAMISMQAGGGAGWNGRRYPHEYDPISSDIYEMSIVAYEIVNRRRS